MRTVNYIGKFCNETAGGARGAAACKTCKSTTLNSEAMLVTTRRKTSLHCALNAMLEYISRFPPHLGGRGESLLKFGWPEHPAFNP
jgi:hypothetical protein